MIVILYPSTSHARCVEIVEHVHQFLVKEGFQTVIAGDQSDQFSIPHVSTIDGHDAGLIISFGGDGALIRCAHQHMHLDAPILGINLGHLGFMADIPIQDIDKSLKDFIAGEYTIQNRLMVETKDPTGKTYTAINDFVLHRSGNPKLIEVSIHVDGTYVNNFVADGIIVAAPNGSTAYSLAAGGPILDPSLEAFVITPVSPHTISNRPIVISSSKKLEIKYLSDSPVDVVIDGVEKFPIDQEQSIHLSRSKQNFKLVNLIRNDFFSTVRSKLGWSGKLH
ncbi:MAG: NAD(+)/NADH kinase [Simkaniaceae bacterium]|nr:NAD(+)/NADH kinase [Simkaniaceae bacterium]